MIGVVGERAFRAERSEIRLARQFVVQVAEVVGRVADDLALVTSELATNAVLHARSPFVIRVVLSTRSVRVLVRDQDPARPALRSSAPTDLGGRGMEIVETVASNWGVDADRSGKWVWAEVELSSDRRVQGGALRCGTHSDAVAPRPSVLD